MIWFLFLLQCPNRSLHCLIDVGKVLHLTFVQILYFNLRDPTSSLTSPTRLRCCAISPQYIAYARTATFGCPFVTKGHAVTPTAAKTTYNAIKFFQEIFHEEDRFPPLESNRIVICYYLADDEGRVLYLTISSVAREDKRILHFELLSDLLVDIINTQPILSRNGSSHRHRLAQHFVVYFIKCSLVSYGLVDCCSRSSFPWRINDQTRKGPLLDRFC